MARVFVTYAHDSEKHKDAVRSLARLLPGRSAGELPHFVSPHIADHYVVRELSGSGVEDLLRVITRKPPRVKPPLGSIPHLPPRAEPELGEGGLGAEGHRSMGDYLAEAFLKCEDAAGEMADKLESANLFGFMGYVAVVPLGYGSAQRFRQAHRHLVHQSELLGVEVPVMDTTVAADS